MAPKRYSFGGKMPKMYREELVKVFSWINNSLAIERVRSLKTDI